MIDWLTVGRLKDSQSSGVTETGIAKGESKEAITLEGLVKKATEGDHDAILSLCQEIAKNVLFHAKCVLRNYDDAGDVAQEVLIRVCTKIRDLNEPKAFKVWLNSIITNETNRYMMKNSKHSVVLNISDYMDAVEEDNDEYLPQEYAIREEVRSAVIDAIDTLPNRQREAVVLHYYEGLSVTETASVMEVSQPRVSECLMLAREKVRHELEKQYRGKMASRMYGMAVVPIGAFMKQALQQEAAIFEPTNVDWMQQTITQCNEVIQSIMPEAAVGAAAWLLTLKAALVTPAAGVAAAAAAVTAAAVTAGVLSPGTAPVPETALPGPDAPAVEIEVAGRVVFTGSGQAHSHINPGRAVPALSANYGEVEILSWTVTTIDGSSILYSGEGGVVDSVLVEMRDGRKDGQYAITFMLQDAYGGTYALKSNFLILTGQG